MGRHKKDFVIYHLNNLSDDDRVVIVLYAYGMYVDDSLHGVNYDRDYKTKKDIVENITNPDWLYAYVIKEEKQVLNDGAEYLVIKASLTE